MIFHTQDSSIDEVPKFELGDRVDVTNFVNESGMYIVKLRSFRICR